ncbi:MAG TPA: DUF4203 domain-containing protein [Vicinamibacterales bacterium]|jgi:hypothetical protein|nr:DUF4203 domain-containing protein [Vicinamibacterales bacterium]
MLPHSYELPAAVLLVLGGALSCFAGYRLFKITLAIYGLIFGAMLASSTMGASNTTGMIVAALAGGIVGALVLVFAYFIGIALVGAGLGALVAHVGWGYLRPGDPPPGVVIVLAVFGAIGSMLLQRYVIVVATAFGGAWTLLLGALALGTRGTERASRVGDVWILYPTAPAPGRGWVPIAWILLGLVGTSVQLGLTGRRR